MISILIATKNEPYLEKTIEDIREHAVTDIEILWKEDKGQGQRAILNELAGKAKHKYILKTDAHCSFGHGFDQIMLDNIEDDMVAAPLLFPLNAEQWEVSHHNRMDSFAFDTNLVMHHVQGKGETMCMQGSCFMTTQKNFFDWELCDESLGSWGHQGVELGIQTWGHGGKCVIVSKTFYGHLFRHSEKDFPYQRNQKEIDDTHNKFIQKFKTKDIGWLVKKFDYPLDWTKEIVATL